MKIPKLNLACSKDDIRPAMRHVQIVNNRAVAVDGHVLVCIDLTPCNLTLPDCYIHAEQWKLIAGKEIFDVKCRIEMYDTYFFLIEKNKTVKVDFILFDKFTEEVGIYPNWQAVIPDIMPEDTLTSNWICVDSKVMSRFLDVFADDVRFRIQTTTPTRAIRFDINYDHDEKIFGYAIVMPYRAKFSDYAMPAPLPPPPAALAPVLAEETVEVEETA